MSVKSMMERMDAIAKFGNVITCKEVAPGVATIVVEHDGKMNSRSMLEFINACTECFPAHPMFETLITGERVSVMVIKAKKKL